MRRHLVSAVPGDDAELVGELPDDPQAVPLRAGPRRRAVPGAVGAAVRADGTRVEDLALQRARLGADDQLPGACTVPHGVGGQFVDRDHHVAHAVFG